VFRAASKRGRSLRVMSRDACAVFGPIGTDVQAKGRNLCYSRDYDHARAPRAEILCEVSGLRGHRMPSILLLMPSKAGRTAPSKARFRRADQPWTEVGYIKTLHGTGTMANDKTGMAQRSGCLLGPSDRADDRFNQVDARHLIRWQPGAVELLPAIIGAAVMGSIRPDIGYEEPRTPTGALDVVPISHGDRAGTVALVHAFAFGGMKPAGPCANLNTREYPNVDV